MREARDERWCKACPLRRLRCTAAMDWALAWRGPGAWSRGRSCHQCRYMRYGISWCYRTGHARHELCGAVAMARSLVQPRRGPG